MQILLSQLKNQIHLRKHLPLTHDSIGSLIRHHRLEKHMTLEEASEGICSVSYLSKVETNQIKVSDKFIDLFKQRFNLVLPNDNYEVFHDEMMHQINYFILKIPSISDFKHDKRNDYHAKLLKLGYDMITGDLKQTVQYVNELITYIRNFNELEFCYYLFLVSKVLCLKGYIKDAFDLLQMMPHIETACLDLSFLCQHQLLMLACKMNHHVYIILKYQNFIDRCLQTEQLTFIHQIKYDYYHYLSQFIHTEDLVKNLKKITHMSQYDKTHILASHYYMKQNYEESNHLLKNNDLRENVHILRLKVLHRLSNKAQMIQALNESIAYNNVHHQLMIEYFKLYYETDIKKRIRFIKKRIMIKHVLPDQAGILYFWYEECVQALKEQSLYKDATTLLQYILRKIRSLSVFS